ncbi:polysaccharide biosynthesis tyrosine autokinase [Glaesserella parasuis]|uniref:polysaccharide biosynthesis tyrosine autokinase n=1 Tax=Glaesserella parasuis TaxID=738 RepID=UPI002436E3A7|nr:polysaccharide biosynthesis tyrosine autokinase [Glaesserella parasuis]MDG6275070.1 polysaccharide biosynthesis tyrosine autokinase [Glaesserella parasuis]
MNENNHDEIDLVKLLGALLDYKWWIALFTLLVTLFGVAYVLLAPPVYTANASIQVESKSSRGLLNDFPGILEGESSSSTEIAILKSRMVLSNTVEQLNLTTVVEPQFSIPFLSKGLHRLMGYEPQLSLSLFEPKNPQMKEMILEVGENAGEFSLFFADEKVLEGSIGKKYQTEDFSFAISELEAKPGQLFKIKKNDVLLAINSLQKQISVTESGKQTGIIEISINGENKAQIKKIVKSVSENYLLQNIVRDSAEASKSLEFLSKQLPELKARLAESENNLNEFRLKNESVDLSLEAKSALDTIVQLEADLNELTLKESEISQKFTRNHPAYVALIDKRKVLNEEKIRLNKQVERLPNTQKEVIRLTRDLEVNQQIYIQLLNKMQELEIVKASTVGNVRILDEAQVLPNAVSPRKMIVVASAFMLGLIFASVTAIAKTLLHRGIEGTSELDVLGLPTYATIPYSNEQPIFSKHKVQHFKLLSESTPTDPAVEALRSLRTSLHFAMLEAKNNILMISGASPSVGKSFISTNLANVLAKAGHKVLLIDADLRRSYLRRLLGLAKEVGLSDVIAQQIPFEQVIQHYDNFDIIVKGETPPNPSELLSNARFQALLEWAAKEYDLVIVDTAPILAVTDAAIIGRYAGTSLLVGRFGETTLKEVGLSKERFERAGVFIKGFILNGIKRKASNRYDYYQYDYK